MVARTDSFRLQSIVALSLTVVTRSRAIALSTSSPRSRMANDEGRRLILQAIFLKLYVESDEVVGHELREPLAEVASVESRLRKAGTVGELKRWAAGLVG